MGADWTAKAVIGVKVPVDKLYDRTKVRTCRHPLPNEEVRYCPTCGRTAWDDDSVIKYDLFKLGVELITGTDHKPLILTLKDFAAYADAYDNDGYGLLPLTGDGLVSIKPKLQAKLEPLGLWDEKAFGLYAVLYCSY